MIKKLGRLIHNLNLSLIIMHLTTASNHHQISPTIARFVFPQVYSTKIVKKIVQLGLRATACVSPIIYEVKSPCPLYFQSQCSPIIERRTHPLCNNTK